MDWEDRLDDWETRARARLQLDGSDWVTLERAAAETGVSRAALRTWYRTGQIPSRLVDGPHGPQRLVPLAVVAERAEASPRLRSTAERRLADEAQLETPPAPRRPAGAAPGRAGAPPGRLTPRPEQWLVAESAASRSG